MTVRPWQTIAAVDTAEGALELRRRGDAPVSLETLAAALPEEPDLPRPSPEEMRAVALELGGSFDLPDGAEPGRTVWRFPRLAAELAAGAGPRAPVRVIAERDLVEELG